MTVSIGLPIQVTALAEALIDASAELIGDEDLAAEVAHEAIREAAKQRGFTVLASRRPPRLSKTRRAEANATARRAFRRIGERDGFHCRICRTTRDLTVDHIIAVVNGGDDNDSNFQLLCRSHNSLKGDQ